jgi:uncharacterized protein DUF6580
MNRDKSLAAIVFCLLVALGVVGRWLGPHDGWLALAPNFTPTAAIGLFAGFFFARRSVALLVPLAALAISNIWLESYGSWQLMAAVYGSFLVAPFLGRALRVNPTPAKIVAAAIVPAVTFYLTTNLMHWIVDGQHIHMMYSRDWNGLAACYAAGIPFFRWMLEGDLLFSGLLFGVYGLAYFTARRQTWFGRFLSLRRICGAKITVASRNESARATAIHVGGPDCRC